MPEADALALVYLRRIDGKVDRLIGDVCDVKVRLIGVEEGLVGVQQRLERLDTRFDRIEAGLDRVEQRPQARTICWDHP